MIATNKWLAMIRSKLSGIDAKICMRSQIADVGSRYEITMHEDTAKRLDANIAESIRNNLGLSKEIKFKRTLIDIDCPLILVASDAYQESKLMYEEFAASEDVKLFLSTFPGSKIIKVEKTNAG